MTTVPSFAHLSDAALTREGERLIRDERHAIASLVSWLTEYDKRRLYLAEGFSSLFTYCREVLHLGEGAAYRRIEAARAARRFPLILDMLDAGELSLTAIGLLAQHLTDANHQAVLRQAAQKSTREVERLVAELAPKPDVPVVIRKLPAPSTAPAPGTHSPAPRAVVPALPPLLRPAPAGHRPLVAPLAPERYRLQITMSREAHDDLRQLQNLMRHSIPSGDAAQIVERALKVLLKDVLRRKCGIVDRPRRGDALARLVDGAGAAGAAAGPAGAATAG